MVTAVSSTVSFDVTEVGREETRAWLRGSARSAGCYGEFAKFWAHFPVEASCDQVPRNMLVIADLARIVTCYLHLGRHRWLASVRRARPYFLALVRTKRDERCASLIDDLMRDSDSRMSVCAVDSEGEIGDSLIRALAALDPESLVQVRYSPAHNDSLWVEFADGLSGYVAWNDMGLGDMVSSFVAESATVGDRGRAIELTTSSGGLFEIDSLSLRSILDREFAHEISAGAHAADEIVGHRVRDARKFTGLTQVELGERAGLDQAVISRLERGVHQPRLDTLRRVATALDMTLSELLAAGT